MGGSRGVAVRLHLADGRKPGMLGGHLGFRSFYDGDEAGAEVDAAGHSQGRASG